MFILYDHSGMSHSFTCACVSRILQLYAYKQHHELANEEPRSVRQVVKTRVFVKACPTVLFVCRVDMATFSDVTA